MNRNYDSSCLKNQFLLAMPGLHGPLFANTLTYICEHNEQGAMGLIINQPLGISVREIFDHLEIECSGTDYGEVMAGGPVQTEQGFILHSSEDKQWESTQEISEGISLTTSVDILADIAQGQGPRSAMIALGYAGWGPGQLEDEIAANAWLTMEADPGVIFNTPVEQRLLAASARLGIDLNLMTSTAGHA